MALDRQKMKQRFERDFYTFAVMLFRAQFEDRFIWSENLHSSCAILSHSHLMRGRSLRRTARSSKCRWSSNARFPVVRSRVRSLP